MASCGGQTSGPSSTSSTSSTGSTASTTSAGDTGEPEHPAPAPGLPSATYSDCTFLDSGGAEYSAASDSTVSVQVNGAGAVVTFTNGNEPTAVLQMVATSASSAVLAAPGEPFAGQWGFCGGGETDSGAIADPGPADAALSLSSATLTVNQGVLFLSLSGDVTDIDGSAGCALDARSGPLTAELVCGTAKATLDGGAVAAAGYVGMDFTPGVFDCSATTSIVAGSGQYNSTIGSSGTLTLEGTGPGLAVTYSGDAYASGTLDFELTSYDTAAPVAGQLVSVACGIFGLTTPIDASDPTVTQVTAASLSTDGRTVIVAFLGDVASGGCSPQTSSTVLECVPHH